MVYVVERYLPGLSRVDLLPRISELETVCGEGSVVRYLGSTIVLGDEACFCQFDGPSEAAVAEANRRAGLPFDRIVPVLLVDSHPRRGDMSVSTPMPQAARSGRSTRLVIVAAVVAVIAALAAWAIATRVVHSGTRPARAGVPTQASVLRSLTPQERQYVLGILSLSPAQLQAAFDTNPTSVQRTGGGSAGHQAAPDVPTQASVLRSLTPQERQYVLGILSLSPAQLQAGFGTSATSVRGGGGSTALPILPACGPGPCWQGAPSTGRAANHHR